MFDYLVAAWWTAAILIFVLSMAINEGRRENVRIYAQTHYPRRKAKRYLQTSLRNEY